MVTDLAERHCNGLEHRSWELLVSCFAPSVIRLGNLNNCPKNERRQRQSESSSPLVLFSFFSSSRKPSVFVLHSFHIRCFHFSLSMTMIDVHQISLFVYFVTGMSRGLFDSFCGLMINLVEKRVKTSSRQRMKPPKD